MAEYIIFALISIILSIAVEKITDFMISGQKLAIMSKINIKRFCMIAVLNLSVWLICFLLHKTAPITALALCIGFDILLCIAIEDVKFRRISNAYLIALLVTAIVVTLIDKSMPWYIHIFGCAMGYLPLFLIRVLGEAVKKQEVLGAGDVYLSGILGLMLGFQNYLLCGIITSVVALIAVRIIRYKKHYDKMHAYPFSPFLALGFTVSLLFGDLIIKKYYDLIFMIF